MSNPKRPCPPDAEHLSGRQKRLRSTVADLRPSRDRHAKFTASGDVCWRCGTPYAQTTAEDLARCTELARSAA
jgi:hypothetical protein